MTIGDRIFERLGEIGMTQKEFSEKTGISQSTISEWKSKRTNPTSEKIMIICDTLNVTPEWILSGSSKTGNRGNELPWYVIDRSTELGRLVSHTGNWMRSSVQGLWDTWRRCGRWMGKRSEAGIHRQDGKQ